MQLMDDLCVASRPGHAPSAGRVLIVKWDRLWADLLRAQVASAFPRSEITVCHSGSDTVRVVRSVAVDYGVFGLTLPDMDGLDLLATLVERRTIPRLMVVSGRGDERTRHLLSRFRLDAYVDTSVSDGHALRAALGRLRDGGPPVHLGPPRASPGLPTVCPLLNLVLSTTELQVFAVIGDGTDDNDAAECLRLSAKTVHCHRQHIMAKLGVRTRTELMRVAIQRGIVRVTVDGVLRPGFERELLERKNGPHGRGNRGGEWTESAAGK